MAKRKQVKKTPRLVEDHGHKAAKKQRALTRKIHTNKVKSAIGIGDKKTTDEIDRLLKEAISEDQIDPRKVDLARALSKRMSARMADLKTKEDSPYQKTKRQQLASEKKRPQKFRYKDPGHELEDFTPKTAAEIFRKASSREDIASEAKRPRKFRSKAVKDPKLTKAAAARAALKRKKR